MERGSWTFVRRHQDAERSLCIRLDVREGRARGLLISRRRHDIQLALGVSGVSLLVGLGWLMLVTLIRCGSAGAFD